MARGNQRPRVQPKPAPPRNTGSQGQYTPSGQYVRPQPPKPAARPGRTGFVRQDGSRAYFDRLAQQGVTSNNPPGTAYVMGSSNLGYGVGVAYDASGKPIGFVRANLEDGARVDYNAEGAAVGVYPKGTGQPKPPEDPGAGTPEDTGGAPAPQGPPPSPYDSDFMGQVAKAMAENQQARREYEQQGEYDQQDLDQFLSRAKRAEGEALNQAGYNANKQGLLYSGQLGKRQGLIQRSTAEDIGDQQTSFDRRAAARRAALNNMGEFKADASNPMGYTATGNAAFQLGDLARAAVSRRRALNAGVEVPY